MSKEHLEPCYNDTDIMPFGMHKGVPIAEVPASYLHWWYHETKADDIKLKNYILNSWNVLKDETKETLIWKLKN